MALDPNPNVTIPGSGVLMHVLNASGEPVPVQGNDDGAITTTGGGGGGGTVSQGDGDVTKPWYMLGVNGGVGERLATEAKQPALGTAGTPSADVLSMQGVSGGTPIPSSNAAATQADGHSASIGATTDADTAQTLIGRIKNLLSRIPAALVGGRFDTNLGAWLGSTAPTVGQKTMANSIPIAIASDQTLTVTPSGTQNVAPANQAATAFFPTRIAYDGTNFVGSGAVSIGLGLPTAVPYLGTYLFAKQTGASTGHSVICSSVGALLVAGQSAVNSTASSINPILVCGQTGATTVNLLCDASGRQLVVGPGASTAATSVSCTEATVSFTVAGSPTAAQNATTKASAGRLHGFRVRGAAAGTYFLQWHDVVSTAGLANATQRGLGFEVSGAGDDFSYTFPKPISFSAGITWALSTAIDSYTAAAGKTVYVDPTWE